MNVHDVNELRNIRSAISETNEKLKKLKQQENDLKTKLIGEMTSEGLSLARTDYGTVSITKQDVASVKDWHAFEDYIYKHKALHLLERRPSNAAYRDEVAVQGTIPGVETFTKINLSLINKVT